MKKLIFIGILIVAGLVMISTEFTNTPVVAQSVTDNASMTDTTDANMSDTTDANMTASGQISKRH